MGRSDWRRTLTKSRRSCLFFPSSLPELPLCARWQTRLKHHWQYASARDDTKLNTQRRNPPHSSCHFSYGVRMWAMTFLLTIIQALLVPTMCLPMFIIFKDRPEMCYCPVWKYVLIDRLRDHMVFINRRATVYGPPRSQLPSWHHKRNRVFSDRCFLNQIQRVILINEWSQCCRWYCSVIKGKDDKSY